MNTNEIEIGTFQAKNELSSLIQLAAKGKRIWITNRGQRVALLSSGINNNQGTGKSLVSRFQEIRNRSKPGKESIKSLIEEGRR